MTGTCVRSGSWFAVVTISRRFVDGFTPIQPQPEPWMPAVVVLNSFLSASSEPNDSTIAVLSGPSRSAPPEPLPSDADPARFFQKSEWLMCPVLAHGGQYLATLMMRLIGGADHYESRHIRQAYPSSHHTGFHGSCS